MNSEEIRAIDAPSRELDKLVAEAMGWTDLKLATATVDLWLGNDPSYSGDRQGRIIVPRYTSSPEAAMEALEGRNYSIQGDGSRVNVIMFYKDKGWSLAASAEAPTLPLAIAKAVALTGVDK